MIGSFGVAVAVLAVLTVAPGPDMAVVTTSAVARGRRAAARTAAGVVTGLLVWGVFTVVGLSAVLAASAEAYLAIKVVGALYLVALGIRTLWRSRAVTPPSHHKCQGVGGEWRTGLLTNLLNPKIAVFYSSVLPQLVPAGAPTGATLFALVIVHAGLGLLWLNAYAWLLTRTKSRLNRPTVRRWLNRINGLVLIGFGVRLAIDSR